MTAIVGILNKKAAVMAADSAMTVTRGDNTRIYNNATKIFKLSDKQPVGAMIFSSDSFMAVPLSVLFGIYREKFGDIFSCLLLARGTIIVRLLQKSLVFL